MQDETSAISRENMNILMKGGEFYQCVQHLHTRGMNEVMKETYKLVDTQMENGVTFENFKEEVLAFMGELPKEGDEFFKNLGLYWVPKEESDVEKV